jgi:hypothetical protein
MLFINFNQLFNVFKDVAAAQRKGLAVETEKKCNAFLKNNFLSQIFLN